MIFSNDRKLILSGWLKTHNNSAYCRSLRLQKFLFLYEVFTKAHAEQPDFTHLRGWKRGPVFSTVWGDYTKDRSEFDSEAINQYNKNEGYINNERAQKAAFIVSSLSERELSDLTHQFNIWNSKAERILNGEPQVELSEQDFGKNDEVLANTLDRMYPSAMIDESEIIPIEDKYFVFSKNDAQDLTEQHYDVMSALAEDENLHNPVFVSIDEKGRLIVD